MYAEEGQEHPSFSDVWEKVRVAKVSYATFLICEEILRNSDSIEDAMEKIDANIKKIRMNNCEDFVNWLTRYLRLY